MRIFIVNFMFYVYKLVNEMSLFYFQNEKRYNYIILKSFLEQIKLYQNLFNKNNSELQVKIIRLENGLEKFRSIVIQVSLYYYCYYKIGLCEFFMCFSYRQFIEFLIMIMFKLMIVINVDFNIV